MRFPVKAAIAVFAVVVGLACVPTAVQAQQAAGVEVDAQNVMHVRVYDRTGQLNRQKLAAARAALDPQLARPSKLRKVSLTRLEAILAERLDNGAGITDEMRYLAGLTRVQYVFCYPESGEVIIAGPAEGFGADVTGRVVGLTSGHAVLELQDLIVALRAYGPNTPPTGLIGCSIDPTTEGLQRMQQFLVKISGRITPADDRRIAEGLRENLGLQNVSVQGVSPQSHFAQVLVEADYRMKLIGIGLEKPAVNIVSYVQRARPSDVSRNALQRWYFVPNYESVRVSNDETAIELVGDGVKLIGEDERVTADGRRLVSGKVDRASKAFTTSFTQKYAELARREPVYAQLRNLIDMAVAAAFIQQHDFYAKANWPLAVFGDESLLPVETYNAPKQVGTAVNVVWRGNTLMTPVGGGVSIQAEKALESDNLLSDDKGQVSAMAEQSQPLNRAPDQWWWD